MSINEHFHDLRFTLGRHVDSARVMLKKQDKSKDQIDCLIKKEAALSLVYYAFILIQVFMYMEF